MSVQIDRQPDVEVGDERRSIQRPRHFMWPLAIFLAMVIAGAAGVIVVAQLTGPPTDSGPVYQEPNANTREGRVPPAPYQEPNANTREGRVPPSPYQEPNANTREGRVPPAPYQEPNANTREGRVTGNS